MRTKFTPLKVYYEQDILQYPLGKQLYDEYRSTGLPMVEIESHNKIPDLRDLPDKEFTRLKQYLILGVRKSLRLLPNTRSADFIVPFTSSGCSAICLYCYLVCTFFKNSYLRIFVNRQEMMNQIRRSARKQDQPKVYEIGSNSDMVLENQITGNLRWAIEEFSRIDNAKCTFATKFSEVDDLLEIEHNGKTQIRMSVNPAEIINKVELGTSRLSDRIVAANKMFKAGYRVGINIAPIVLVEGWQDEYLKLMGELKHNLDDELQRQTFFELIFMTYGLANEIINAAALPKALNVFEKEKMRPKGRGKYCYKTDIHTEAAEFFRKQLQLHFPKAEISYIV